MINPDIFVGWARNAVAENMKVMPAFVASAISPDCKNPEGMWKMLLRVEQRRKGLVDGTLPPRSVNYDESHNLGTALDILDYEAHKVATYLAWGMIDGN